MSGKLLALTMLFAFSAFSQATAQTVDTEDLKLPVPGASGSFPAGTTYSLDAVGTDVASVMAGGSAFLMPFKMNLPKTRGARDVTVFRDVAPAVVLIVTKDGLGSGSVVENGLILTNWHVIRGHRQVNVIFKPANPVAHLSDGDMVTANVVKTDPLRDLALLQPLALPAQLIKPIKIAKDDRIEVGADVHAIGHPTGEAWTYTTGIVSQIRPDYEWTGGKDDIKHRATVIQTQTPINPGNSGGPLLTDDEQLVGINSFVATNAQGLNFAVSAKDVNAFLAAPASQPVVQEDCKPRVIFEGRNNDGTAFLRRISLNCDERADIIIVLPDNIRKPVLALFDTKRRDKVDGIALDEKRNGKWNTSFWDPEVTDTFPLRGIHPGGELMPTRMVPRCRPPSKPLTNFRCS
jgi:S1-C subfamily serine protease